MNELEQGTAEPEPTLSTAAPPADAALDAPDASDASDAHHASVPSEPELEPPPVWEDPNQPDSEPYPEPTGDAWAFIQDAAPTPAREGSIERALIAGLFKPNSADLLGLVERALRSRPRSKPAVRLLALVSRARVAKATEPRLIESLLRAQADGQVTDDFGLLAALLARRLVLPSLRAEPRATPAALRLRVLREVHTLAQRVSRARGEEGLRELAKLSTQLGAQASERGHGLEELALLLRRRFERRESTSARPALDTDARGSRRPRRFRLPGRVEIVIYEE